MLNPDVVGRTYKGANSFTVTQESIDEFALAIGEPNTKVAPPTFSIKFSLTEMQAFLQDSGVNWDRVVHGDQRFEIHRPLVAGDIITGESTVESTRVMAGNEFVSVRTDIYSGTELVISSWITLVVRA